MHIFGEIQSNSSEAGKGMDLETMSLTVWRNLRVGQYGLKRIKRYDTRWATYCMVISSAVLDEVHVALADTQ